jgi:hypothetical protein
MTTLLRWALRRGLRRGLFGGERLWLVVGGAALLAKLGLRALHREPEVVFSEKMRLGERLTITHRPPSGHNGRRESPAAQPKA